MELHTRKCQAQTAYRPESRPVSTWNCIQEDVCPAEVFVCHYLASSTPYQEFLQNHLEVGIVLGACVRSQGVYLKDQYLLAGHQVFAVALDLHQVLGETWFAATWALQLAKSSEVFQYPDSAHGGSRHIQVDDQNTACSGVHAAASSHEVRQGSTVGHSVVGKQTKTKLMSVQ